MPWLTRPCTLKQNKTQLGLWKLSKMDSSRPMSQMVSLFPVLLQQGWRIMCTVKEESDDSPARDVAKAILQVLADYTVNCQRGGPMSWENAEGFLPTIMSFVQKQEPARMVLPALSFKSQLPG